MISSSVSGNHSNNITSINNNNITVAGNYSLNPTSSNIIHNNGDSNKYPNQKVYITNNNSSSNYAQKANKNFTINEQYNENSKQQEGKKQSRKPPSSSTNITKNKKKQDFEILHFRANITRKDGNKVMKKRKQQPKFHYCYFQPENISQEVTTNGISSTNNNNNKKLKSNKEKRIVEDERENLSKNLEKTEQLFNTQNGTDLLTSYDDLVNPTLKILNCNVFKTTSYTYYLNYISFGFPIISQHALEQNFFNEEAMEGKYENDVLALLYSIHAMVCQVVTGQIEQCDDAFKKAIILMDEFSCSCKSVACAGCFCFISIHFLTKGNSEFARKCLGRVDEFLCLRNENYRTGQYIGYNMQLETELNTNYSIYFDLPEDILHLTKFRIICGIAFDDHSLLCYDYNNHKLSYSSNLFFEKFGIQFYNQKSLVSKLLSNMYLYSIGKLPCEIIRIVSQPLTKESVLLYTTLLEVLKVSISIYDFIKALHIL